MTNFFAEDVAPQSKGNFFADTLSSTAVDEQEQDVINRTNDPLKETPISFGLVDYGAEPTKGLLSAFTRIPEIGFQALVQAGNESEGMKGDSTADIAKMSFAKRFARNMEEGDPELKALLQSVWGAEKDALLSLVSDGEIPTVMRNSGNAMMAASQSAHQAFGLTPKGGSNTAYDIGNGFGQLMIQIGSAAVTKSPSLGMAYIGALTETGDYKECMLTGKGTEECTAVASASAAGQMMMEGAGTKIWFAATKASSGFRRIATHIAEQFTEESSQATWEEIVKGVSGVRNTDFSEKLWNVIYQGTIGAIVAAPMSVIHSTMYEAAKKENLPPEIVPPLAENLVRGRDELADAATIMIDKETAGVTNDDPAKAETLSAIKEIRTAQDDIAKATAEGSTQDPQIAANILLKSKNISEGNKAAIRDLEPGFTMEQLSEIVKNQDTLTPDEGAGTPIAPPASTKTSNGDLLLSESLALEDKQATVWQERLDSWRETTAPIREVASLTKKQIKETQTRLVDFINQSGLEAADKAKFLPMLKNTQTANQLINNVQEIEDRIGAMIEVSQKKAIKGKIKSLLNKTKPTKQSGKPVGKFADADLQGVMDVLRADIKLTKEQAQNKLDKNLSEEPTAESALENSVLAIIADPEGATAENMSETLSTISDLIDGGKAGKVKAIAERKERISVTKEQVVEGVTKGRDIDDISKINLKDRLIKALNVVRAGESGLNNGWFDTLDILLGKTDSGRAAREKLSKPVHQAIQKEAGMVIDLGNNFVKLAKDIFGIKNNGALRRKFIKDEKLVNLGKFSRDGQDQTDDATPGKAIPWELSVAQGRKLWMELQDPKLRKTLVSKNGNGITAEMEAMLDPEKNDFLTPQDIEFAKAQMKFYKEIYPKVDKVYASIYGIHLPKNPFYSPIRREHKEKIGDSNEFLQDLKSRQSAAPGSVKSRVETNAKILEQSDITTLLKHIAEASHFISMAEVSRDLNSVFSDPTVRRTIDATWGRGMLQNIDGYIGDFTAGHIQRAEDWWGMLDVFNSNFAKSVLGAKLNMVPKQMSSMFAYATEIPPHHFMAGLADFAKNPAAAIRVLSKSDLMRKRGSSQDVDIAKGAQQQAGKLFGQRQALDDFLLYPIKLGDRGAIYTGGWAVYKYNRDVLGKTHEESIAEFERVTADVAQSSDLDKLSRFQASKNPFMRTMGMFMTAPNSYYRLEKRAIRQAFRGEISKADAAKKLVILHFLLPALFQYIANGFHWDDDDETRAMALGSLNGFMILGSILESAIAELQGIYYPERGLNFVAGAQDLFDAGVKSYKKGEIAFSDILDSLGLLTGLPAKSIENIVGGIEDVSEGDTVMGAKRIAGFTEKTAKKAESPKESKGRRSFSQ